MNWIILIVAGLCEVGFTYCLGRAKSVEGLEWWLWIGGFTTFSTFSKEALMMLQAGNFMSLMAYVAISVIAGIALVAAGYYLVRL